MGLLTALVAITSLHTEWERRIARPPQEVAGELALIYGHEFDSAVYIPGIALIAQLKLGHQAEVERLAAPYLDGRKDSLAKPTGSHLAGHLVFAELAERTADPRYVALVRKAADIAMPLHDEMSDAVFMGCPILAKAGKLTGDSRYFEMSLSHLRLMQKLCLRPDGLYRHSPLTDAAWGRGNAFPALGLALALSDIPQDHPAFREMLHSYQEHCAKLARQQDADGMWHEVINRPDSYAEYSATAMIATALLRGVSKGWLGDSYRPRIKMAWSAISARTGSEGSLVNVCESTGKQKSLEDYLNRKAIQGRDARGGAMGLLFAVEVGQALGMSAQVRRALGLSAREKTGAVDRD
jgi:unsaturated rhamnogalacturonyl hydrolase